MKAALQVTSNRFCARIINMSNPSVQDILARVQKPSRYLGTEVNSLHKRFESANLNMVLAFPDLYEIGTSHFGIQILYHLLNRHAHINAERVFAPAGDMEHLLRENQIALCSLESGHRLVEFDIVGFSLLYELNFTNVLNMLDLAGIPLRHQQREDKHPLIIAGGPCVCNPEPMADFFDAMVFGDGEQVILEMAEQWLAWRHDGRGPKSALLQRWSRIEGVYVPGLYRTAYDADGFQHLTAGEAVTGSISRRIVSDLDQAFFPSRPVIPFGKPVHDRLRIEISRGCSRGCRFCQAGMIYRPVRERSADTILDLVKQALDNTGYDDLSLLSLSTGDYTCLGGLMENVMHLGQADRVAVSLPSLRAGTLTPKLMQLIRSVRKTGFTIAPEAGSQRLRDVINKNITYEDVAATVKDAFEFGWRVIKLYFMIGLPTETDEDLDAIVAMVRRLKMIKGPGRGRGQLNVSITTFVPKPHTPFQWAPQISLEESKRKIAFLKAALGLPGVRVKWQHPEMSRLEGALSRGDRRMGMVIEEAWKSGCTFDGWNDQFDFNRWQAAFVKCGVDPQFYIDRRRNPDEPLPWAHMNSRIDTGFLKYQWERAHHGEKILDCRHGHCHACGICDFESLHPRVFNDCPAVSATQDQAESDGGETYRWLVLTYSKLEQARFFGHLEVANMFARAVRRAKIHVQYSKGFHPMPRFSFDDPLPLGMASEAEQMRMMVASRHDCSQVARNIDAHLPAGLRITGCRPRDEVMKSQTQAMQKAYRYRIDLGGVHPDACLLGQFQESDQWPYTRTRQNKDNKVVDLRAAIATVDYHQPDQLVLEIRAMPPITVRPADFLSGVLQLSARQIQQAVVTKLAG